MSPFYFIFVLWSIYSVLVLTGLGLFISNLLSPTTTYIENKKSFKWLFIHVLCTHHVRIFMNMLIFLGNVLKSSWLNILFKSTKYYYYCRIYSYFGFSRGQIRHTSLFWLFSAIYSCVLWHAISYQPERNGVVWLYVNGINKKYSPNDIIGDCVSIHFIRTHVIVT